MTRVVSVTNASVRFGSRAIFDGFDLQLDAFETLAILGPSGCGKSTLLRAIAGLLELHAGSLDVDGAIGFVFQEPRLMPWLTLERNVAFAARDAREHARVAEAIDLVGLAHAAQLLPKALSGGMAQRAALARTLVRQPNILLLDEPLSALDALTRIELQSHLALAVSSSGAAAILVTHDVDEALFLADRILVLGDLPARVKLEIAIPADRRRSRFADLGAQKIALLEALGVTPSPHAADAKNMPVAVRASSAGDW